MRKQWISVKCGLSRDPKHRRQMGKAVWTFLHMLDMADWETGVVYDWKDENAAEDMGIDIRVLREDRRKLEQDDYISCKQKQYGQDITIMNWTNPREYSGDIHNKKQSYKKYPPSKNAQGDAQGDAQGSTKDVTPTLYSKNQIPPDVFSEPEPTPQGTAYRRGEQEQPDKVSQYLKMALSPGMKQQFRIDAILSYLGESFNRSTETKECKDFAKEIDSRHISDNWDVSVFVAWLKSQPKYDPLYWSWKRMKEYYPSAFVESQTKPAPKTYNPSEDIEPEYVPAPPRKR